MSVTQPRFIVSTRIRRRYDNIMTKLVFTIIQTIQIKKPSAELTPISWTQLMGYFYAL